MSVPLLEVEKISKRFGGFQALREVSLHIYIGERVGLIGPNGSGKSTLIGIISGLQACDRGKVFFHRQEITTWPAYRRARLGIARSFQIPRPFPSMTVLDNVCIPLEYATHEKSSQSQVVDEAQQILQRVGLISKRNVKSTELTQIDLRRLELARALAIKPKLLLLDEVMAGLSTGEVDELLGLLYELNRQGIAVVMVEHIMRAVMGFSQRVVVLNAGSKIAEGTPEEIVKIEEVERIYLGE
ncbi:MAG TPA: ABC transporter ATP-binding protein [Candidatus Limnocylindrales bacterium]|nr:ABC transporter ATP-binding protein [Candidatus Limnocylindrales bacterium]